MNNYQRLTPKDRIELLNVNNSDDMTRFILYANRLWDIENELENGMLIKPPCKVGDALYAIMDVDYEYTIVEFRARNIEIGEYGKFYINTPTGYSHRLTFGINVFTNKAQAEARLKELKGE